MLSKEIIGTLKSKRVLIFILIMIIIPLIDIGMVYNREKVWEKRANKEEILESDRILKELCEKEGGLCISNWIIHPAKAAFLSGSSEGHLTQIILIWLMPVFVLNLYSDRYVSEYSRGYVNIMVTRMSKKKYMISKCIASFLLPFIIFFVSLLINFCVAQILFYEGDSFRGAELFIGDDGWFNFMYTVPNAIYLIYILITSVVAGMCGVICQCIALLSKKYTITYLVTFFIWMGLIMMDDSITYLIQPFTEYGINYMVRGGAILFMLVTVLVIITARLKVKQDEL